MNATLEFALRARIQILTDENEHLRSALGADLIVPPDWGYSPIETVLLGHLLARPIVSRDSAMTVIYAARVDDEPQPKIIDIWMCKVRKRLRALNVSLHSRFTQGWWIAAADKARLRDRIARDMAVFFGGQAA